ncbi:MAG: hypothetical protein KC613_16520 [Myxococcales bacterium]|nr:hypothetical protein [Myxococcales bacterium]MCB9524169.1 hypothetical protein [Myxococcales bacterium]
MSDDPLVQEFQGLIERLGREVASDAVARSLQPLLASMTEKADQVRASLRDTSAGLEQDIRSAKKTGEVLARKADSFSAAAGKMQDQAGRFDQATAGLAKAFQLVSEDLDSKLSRQLAEADQKANAMYQQTLVSVQQSQNEVVTQIRSMVLVASVVNAIVVLVGVAFAVMAK